MGIAAHGVRTTPLIDDPVDGRAVHTVAGYLHRPLPLGISMRHHVPHRETAVSRF